MKYKIGDEVLVKARINSVSNIGTGLPYEVKEIDNKEDRPRTIWVSEQDIQEVPDMTSEEAWEIAKKLFADYSNAELDEIFGRGWSFPKLMELTPQQAKAKIEAWGVEKEIKVGDIVRPKTTKGREYMVTYISESRKLAGVCLQTGEVIPEAFEVSADSVVKTGRHIDIEGILKQIGGTDA